jgi:hypothetical protein
MLDRKTILTVLVFFLGMMVSAIWCIAYGVHRSAILFFLPVSLMIFAGVWQWWMARAEGDLPAWTKWSGFLAISYAAICAGFQLMFVMALLKVIALPASSLTRVLIAVFGAQLLVLGNWKAKLPPLKTWRPASLSLGAAGEAAMLRFEGWLLVAYGLITVASALLIPMSLIAPLFVSMSLASLIVIVIRRRQLGKTLTQT